jgi:uncharacterized protein YggE
MASTGSSIIQIAKPPGFPTFISTTEQQKIKYTSITDVVNDTRLSVKRKASDLTTPKRIINVSAIGEFELPPDKAKLLITIRSCKSDVNEARNSIQRRLDYIVQNLKKNKVKVTIITL